MRISDRSRTDFDRANLKLTAYFGRRPIGRKNELNATVKHRMKRIKFVQVLSVMVRRMQRP